jgi:hypothetical protein
MAERWSAAAIFEGEFSNLTRSYADKGIGGIPRSRSIPLLTLT